MHGYGIAQHIGRLSAEALRVEEGSLYPALQRLRLKGWVKAGWKVSDTGREVREYRITPAGKKQLELEMAEYRRTARAVGLLLDVDESVQRRTLFVGTHQPKLIVLAVQGEQFGGEGAQRLRGHTAAAEVGP